MKRDLWQASRHNKLASKLRKQREMELKGTIKCKLAQKIAKLKETLINESLDPAKQLAWKNIPFFLVDFHRIVSLTWHHKKFQRKFLLNVGIYQLEKLKMARRMIWLVKC